MKNFIKAILFMFMIGMVVDISPQSTDPPSKEQIELEKSIDLMAVSHQELSTPAHSLSAPAIQLSAPVSEIELSDPEAGKYKEKTTAIKELIQLYSDKHYDPGSCASYLFI